MTGRAFCLKGCYHVQGEKDRHPYAKPCEEERNATVPIGILKDAPQVVEHLGTPKDAEQYIKQRGCETRHKAVGEKPRVTIYEQVIKKLAHVASHLEIGIMMHSSVTVRCASPSACP